MGKKLAQQDPLKTLHESLLRDNVDVPADYASFQNNLSDPAKAAKMYEFLKSENYDVPDNYNSFESTLQIGSKKKDQTSSVDSSPGVSHPFLELDTPGAQLPQSDIQQAPQPTLGELAFKGGLNKQAADQSAKEFVMQTGGYEKPGFLVSLGRSIGSVLGDQIPKEYYTQRLRMSKGEFGDLFDPRSDINAFGDKLPKEINREEFYQWNNKQPDKIRTQTYDERAKMFITEKLGPDGYEALKKSFEEKNPQERLGFEREIQQQNVEAARRNEFQVQNLKDIKGASDFLSFAGNMLGQSLGRLPVSIVTGGVGSLVSESAAVYDRQLDLIAKDKGISREEVIKQGLDKPAEGQALAVLAGELDAVSEFNIIGLFRKSVTKELTENTIKNFVKGFIPQAAKSGTVEAITETAQGELEELGANQGAGTDYSADVWRMATSAAGGFIGGGGASMASQVASKNPIIKQEASDDVGSINFADRALSQQEPVVQEETPAHVVAPAVVEPTPTNVKKVETPTGPESGKIEFKSPNEVVLPTAVSPEVTAYREVNKSPDQAVTAKEQIIADHLSRFPTASFNRYGDPNFMSDTNIARMMYLSKKGIPIDVQAQDMSYVINPDGDGTDITPQDIVDFVNRFPRGKKQFEALTAKDTDAIADNIVDENPGIQDNSRLMYDLELIEKNGITAENFESPAIQELLNNTLVYDEQDRQNINLIFEYAKTEEGRKKIDQLRTQQAEPGVQPAVEGSGLPEVQSEQTTNAPGEEVVPDWVTENATIQPEGNTGVQPDITGEVPQTGVNPVAVEEPVPAKQTKPSTAVLEAAGAGDKVYANTPAPVKRKKKKATIKSTEHKASKISNKISDPAHFKVENGKTVPTTEEGKKIMDQYNRVYERHKRLMGKRYHGEQGSSEKFYEPPIGAPTKKSKPTRVSVSPVYGGKVKLLRDIMLDLSKSIANPIFYTKRPIKGRRAIGSYSPSNAAIAIKFKGDLDVTAHELGHSLDDKYGILQAVPPANKTAIEAELKELSKWGSKPPKGHPDKNAYRMGEGIAEFIRAYLVNPKNTESRYPAMSSWFKQAVPQPVIDKINVFGQDIRTYAGLTGHEQIMSNVQFDPEKKQGGILSWFKPTATGKENFKITWMDRLATKFTNDKTYFNKAVKFLEETQGVKLTPSKDPSMLARVLAGSNEKIDNIIEKGLVNNKNQRVKDPVTNSDKSFEWLLRPYDNTDMASLQKEQQEAISYMIAERTIALAKRFQRSDILTGIGAGINSDVAVAQKRIAEFKDYSQQKQHRLNEAIRRYREYADSVLQYMVDKGRMSQEQFDQIKKDNTEYVALNRILEVAPGEEIIVYKPGKGEKALGSTSQIVHRIKGSSALIQNPYESLIETAVKSIKEADRNEVMLSFRDLFRYARGMGNGDPKLTSDIARPATSKDKNVVQIFVDGKSEYWQMDPDVYSAIKNITDAGTTLPFIITALPKLLRASVTNFPVFALRNRIRDIQQRFVVSDTKAYKGFDIYTNKKTRELNKDLFQLFGGGQAGHYMMNDDFYYKQMEKAAKEITKEKGSILTTPKKLLDAYQGLLSGSERATRLEEYRSAYKAGKAQGMDDYNASIYAAYKARDLLDFSVAGEWMRVINQMIPFSNAAVQGLKKTISSAADNPGSFAIRFMVFAVIPAIMTRLLVNWMEEDEEYTNLPNYRRDLFYNIPIGPNMWLSIPKPFEIGVIATGIERAFSKYALGEDKALEGYFSSLARAVIPVDESAFAVGPKPFLEVATDYDFFRDKAIIPPNQVGMDLELRDTSGASRLGKSLQKVLQVDARYIDHLIKGTASYFGDFALRTSDIARDDSRYKFDWTTTGLFRNDPVYESRDVQAVMKLVDRKGIHWKDPWFQQLNMMLATYFEAPKEERDAIGDEIREYAREVRDVYENDEYYQPVEQEEEEDEEN